MSRLKFDFTSSLMMINIYLWNKKSSKFENMLITFDTGASNTVISKDILHILGYEFGDKEKTRVITASFSMGVLGLNIMKKFDISLLFSTGELVIINQNE